MKQFSKTLATILESIIFSFWGTLYAAFAIGFIEFGYDKFGNQSGLQADRPSEPNLGWLWIMVGLIVSFLFVRVSFSRLSKTYIWLTKILLASIFTVIIQNLYFSYFIARYYGDSLHIVSYWWILKMFVVLIPYTLFFANRKFYTEMKSLR
jgi:hypothetical protein